MSFRKYSDTYEDGKCPYGYEYVHSYRDRYGTWHNSYCRKLPKHRRDPEEKMEERERRLREKSDQEALKIVFGDFED